MLGSAQPRYGLHPTIGAITPSTPSQILGTSARFNPPDGVWNNGEGFVRSSRSGFTLPTNAPADTGGLHVLDDGRDLVPEDVHVQGAWALRSYTNPNVSQGPTVDMHLLRGFLYPHEFFGSGAGIDGFVAETAFELMIPDDFVPNQPIVILLAQTGTGSYGSNGAGRYPGEPSQSTHPTVPSAFIDPANAGLQGSGNEVWRYAELDRLVSFSGTPAAGGFNIIAGYIVPPLVVGHGPLTIQRYLQFERAIQHILDANSGPLEPPVEIPAVDRAVISMGGSNGGNVSMFLATMFPDRFHGAMSTQFSLSMRHTVGYQEFFAQTAALQGFGEATYAHGVQYNFAYSGMCAFNGFSHGYATGTPLAVWEAGLLKRPLFVHAADEDTVWNAHEEIPLINTGVYAPRGESTPRSGSPSANSASIYWMCIDKACHFDAGKYVLPTTLVDANTAMSGDQYDHALSVLAFLDEVVESRQAAALSMNDRPTESQVLAALFPTGSEYDPDASHDPRLDPFDHALSRRSTHERRISLPTSQPLDLVEDVAVRSAQRGLGTGLGYGGSLVVDEAGGIWVGSADGVVTRLVRNHPSTELVIDVRCTWSSSDDPQTGPFSLGYGVTGLAVSGDWVAVGTHRRLCVFDRQSMSGIAQPRFTVELPWSEQRPSRMKLVDDLFGDGGSFVVYLSHMGELVVREIDTDLPRCAQVSDPDAWDFEIGSGHRAGGLSRPIYVSSRYHIIEFDIYPGFGGSPVSHNPHVLASSPLVDRASLAWGQNASGETVLTAFSASSGVYEFFVGGSQRLAVEQNWQLPPASQSLYATDTSTAPLALRSLGDGVFVGLRGGQLFYAPSPSAIEKYDLEPGQETSLAKFPAAYYASAIAVGDVDGDEELDVVLATESGQVVYIPRDMLASGDLSPVISAVLGSEWVAGAPTTPTPAAYSSGSVVATWGMTWGPSACGGTGDWVQVVDQCSRRWEIKPDAAAGCPTIGVGQPVYRNMVRDEVLVSASMTWSPRIAPKPFRDLVRMEAPTPSVFPNEQRRDMTPFAIGSGVYVKAFKPFDQFTRLGAGFPVPPDIIAPPGATTATSPYYPPTSGVTTLPYYHRQLFEHGYMPISFGGDRLEFPSGRIEAFFWTGSRAFVDQHSSVGLWPNTIIEPAAYFQCHDAVRGLIYSEPPSIGMSGSQSFWSTTSSGNPHGSGTQLHLRNTVSFGTPHDAQSLRLGNWDGESRAVLTTAGGGILVLDPSEPLSAPSVLTELGPESGGDHGFGGLALCVAKVVDASGAPPTIFMGTLYGQGRARTTGLIPVWGSDMIPCSIWVYDYDATTGLSQIGEARFDGSSSDRPLLLGLCGLAVGDLLDEATDGCSQELVVTTFGGDLLVFDIDAGGSVGALLHHSIHDGALGANNAILIDESATPKTLFIAGSMGMHRFSVSTGGL